MYNQWSESDQLSHLKVALRGQAQHVWLESEKCCNSYDQLKSNLLQRFGAQGRSVQFRAELRARRRHKGESLQSLYLDICKISLLAYPGFETDDINEMMVECFVQSR